MNPFDTSADLDPGMARAELARAAVAAYGQERAAQLLRALENAIVETAHRIIDERYETLVRAIAERIRPGIRTVEGVDPLIEVERALEDVRDDDLFRDWRAAVTLSIGPLHVDRSDDGSIDYEFEQAVMRDIADVLAGGWDAA